MSDEELLEEIVGILIVFSVVIFVMLAGGGEDEDR